MTSYMHCFQKGNKVSCHLLKENAKKHVPFAGERSLGEKAKLYLSLERKDNEVVSDRPGPSATDS